MKSADKSADKKRGGSLPGTLWESHGAWHWRVTLPGEDKRKDRTLTMPFTGARIPAGASTRSVAESAAWRMWEDAAKRAEGGDGAPAFTVNDLCAKWAAHAAAYYSESQEAADSVRGLRTFRDMFGTRPIESMTHPDMIDYRSALAEKGYVRTTVNKYLGYAKRMFAWALDERLVSAQVKAECTAISPLKPHRGKVRESEPISAVSDADVEATCANLPPSLADMVRVHRLCGARPDEICNLSWDCVERRGKVWAYRPKKHKNKFRNKPRVIVLGPRAQGILEKYRLADERAGVKLPYVFSPQRAIAERWHGGGRLVGARWKVEAYHRAVSRAAEAAGVGHWHPNQLRHTCATEVRRRFGIEAASAVLGHTLGLRITDRYSFEAAEDEIIRAATPAMEEMG